uniref:Vesicle-fusing ATPase n=1 Tax=Steinernema glaseri TaxID=37863 RepID=A0A1I7YG71_9BILA
VTLAKKKGNDWSSPKCSLLDVRLTPFDFCPNSSENCDVLSSPPRLPTLSLSCFCIPAASSNSNPKRNQTVAVGDKVELGSDSTVSQKVTFRFFDTRLTIRLVLISENGSQL